MKKVLTSLISVGLLAAPVIALAQEPPVAPLLNVITVLCRITNWLFGILLIIAAIAIIVAAYLFVTATGDPDKTKRARDFVLYAVIGVIVAFVAKGLVLLVGTITGQQISWWCGI